MQSPPICPSTESLELALARHRILRRVAPEASRLRSLLKRLLAATVVASALFASAPVAPAQSCAPGTNRSLSFSGTNGYVFIQDVPILDLSTDFTIEFWMRCTASFFERGLIDKWAHSVFNFDPNRGYGITVSNDHKLHVYLGSGPNPVMGGTHTVDDNLWHHVALVRSAAAVTLWVDSAVDASLTFAPALQNAAAPLILGGMSDQSLGQPAGNYLSGGLDEVRVWNLARTPAELKASRYYTLSGLEPGLVGYWRADEGGGTLLVDWSQSGVNGTLKPNGAGPTWLQMPWGPMLYCNTGTYCVAKQNSFACLPDIQSSGVPSATSGSGFTIHCPNVRNNKNGLLFYSITGLTSAPYQGGTLCVLPPIKRTPVINSAGDPPPNSNCTGDYVIDFNAFIASGAGIPALQVPGTIVYCQWWGRDPAFLPPNDTTLSNALMFTVGP